jgi:cell division protein FtsZ
MGILVVGVVTKPFAFEGDKRMRTADRGIIELQQFVHTLIVIPNQNLFRVANDRTTFAQAFAMADEVLHAGVRGVTDLIVMPGLINLDFADIKSVISEMGKAMMGTGEAEGEDRAQKAADMAISNPLLDDVSMKGARGVLINITGGPDLMLFEVEQAANRIRAEVDPDANIIFGNTILDDMEGRIRVSVVATGIDAEELNIVNQKVQPLRPHLKPVPIKAEPRSEPRAEQRPVVGANAVHIQHEVLADELGAQLPQRAPTPIEAMILGGDEAPQIEEEEIAAPAPARQVPAARAEPVRTIAPPAESERKFFGLFGRRKKDEPRLDATTRSPTAPRPAAQAMARPPVEAPRPQPAPQNSADDLFPDHKRDEQFEIPAFLRRQTN